MGKMTTERLIRSCLYNFLGYGNPNASTWFVGMEEGGHEVWKKEPAIPLERSLAIRSKFKPAMDFQYVWRKLFGYGNSLDGVLTTRNNVWRFIAAFDLYQKGKLTSRSSSEEAETAITNFLKKDFGRLSGGLFFAEFMPLPRNGRESLPDLYHAVWNSDILYDQEVAPKRFYLIAQAMRENSKLRNVVSFSKDFTEYFLSSYPVNSGKEKGFPTTLLKDWQASDGKRFRLYSVKLEKGKTMKFLDSPFFGYMGYGPEWYDKKGLPYASRLMHN